MRSIGAWGLVGLWASLAVAGVQFDTSSKFAPDVSSEASGLASGPGGKLYYMVLGGLAGEELWVSNDGGTTWSYPEVLGPWPDWPNGPSAAFLSNQSWGSNFLQYYSGLGSQGALILRTEDPEPDPWGTYHGKMVWFDIAGNTWNWLNATAGTITAAGHGGTLAGNHFYGVWHAGGGNFGGPICRVDLAAPGTIDQRTVLSGLSGLDAGWFSRAAQLARVNIGGTDYIYGIKNDWATPQPPTAGDRLFRFAASTFTPSTFDGGNPWDDTQWHAATTAATDLARLPFEPGSGSCLVALPPDWSSEIGAQGGLFIIAGESPSNHEGWAEASSLFALYDIASDTFYTRSLPGVTGTGTSAVLHNNQVYIKRGRTPDENFDLWIAGGTTAQPCLAQTEVAVISTPLAGVSIDVLPADCAGQADGLTPFARQYSTGDYVVLDAPAVTGYRFLEWNVDGDPVTTDFNLLLQASYNQTAEAVYALRCDLLAIPFSVSSTPFTGVTITYTPADCSGGSAASTPFTSNFGDGETVTFSAPFVPGYDFVRWTIGGVEVSSSPTLIRTISSTELAVAEYEQAVPPYVDGCLEFLTWNTPTAGSFGTALASDGTNLYFLQEGGEFYRSADDGYTWSVLTNAPGGDAGDDGALAYAPGLGSAGSLITRRNAEGEERLCSYDIATGAWSTRGGRAFGNVGFVVAGDHILGNAHAVDINQGGPITRAALSDLDASVCQRTHLSGIQGLDPRWFSRVVQMTSLDGLIYGIKNDWTTPQPANAGDRLWRFDPAAYNANIWHGIPGDPYHLYWDTTNWTPATDLGKVPYEIGYGSAIVALPANFNCDIGSAGGLLIVPGRSPSNNEGWGNASNKYLLFDVAGGLFTVGTLPGVTGSGTSGTFHNGRVYIKRGGNPDSPYNTELWVISGTSNDPCSGPQFPLSVQSTPSGVEIDVAPADCNGLSGGTTAFLRSFGSGQVVSLTAPASLSARIFTEWQVAGAVVLTTPENPVEFAMSGAVTARAVYDLRCDVNPIGISVSSTPISGLTITYSPADCSGGLSGVTPFAPTVGGGETITFLAPGLPGYLFEKWQVDGVDAGTTPALELAIDASVALTAVYTSATPPWDDGCLRFHRDVAVPENGEWGTALATDGTSLYFLQESGALYRSNDGGYTWSALAAALGTDAMDDGALAYAASLGSAGSLITRRNVAGEEVLCTYDIAADTWAARGQRAFGNTGYVVVGDYLYGNGHAIMVNQGGPICRAELADLDGYVCARTEIRPSMLGQDPAWFSRVVQFAAVNSRIYGIKNDWSWDGETPGPGDGDRLYLFNAADYDANTWGGVPGDPLHLNWTTTQSTPASDLGLLPFEPGYGSALVALPAYWSCEVGNKGGLFILAGRSPSSGEGWGNPEVPGAPSDFYTIYDIASGQFAAVGALPASTGSGASVTFHAGKIYIKRGAGAEDPAEYNRELWVVEPVSGFPCGNPPQDADQDDDVDLADFAYVQECFGAYAPENGPCGCLDIDDNDDVDLADVAAFETCLAGPRAASPCTTP